MKKIFIVSSTPRKGGNSDLLCDRFALGAKESGNEVEKVFLKDKKIHYCMGCGYCNENSKSGCSQKDDMAELIQKMIAADVIVLATPVYFYTMCAQMKTFIDRTCSDYTKISGKEFYYILSAADSNIDAMEKTVESFRGFTLDCLPNAEEKGIIYGVGAWKIGDIKNCKAWQEAYLTGKNV